MLTVRTEGMTHRVVVSGGVGEVRASVASGESWVVRPPGPAVSVVDPRAPLAETITYTDAESSVTEVRDPDILTAFTSLDGLVRVDFGLSQDWSSPLQTSASVLRVPGRSYVVHGREVFEGPLQVRAIIAGENIRRFEDLVRSQKRVTMLHNRSKCSVPFCPAPDVVVGDITAVSGEDMGRKDRAQMVFRVTLDPIGLGRRLVVPARTWADVKAGHEDWAAVDAAYGSWAGVRDGRL